MLATSQVSLWSRSYSVRTTTHIFISIHFYIGGLIVAQTVKPEISLKNAVAYAMHHFEQQRKGTKLATMYLCGSPGIGKSEYIMQAAYKYGYTCVPVTVGLIRVERFTGIPDFKREAIGSKYELNTEWSVPELVATLRRATYIKKEDVPVLIEEATKMDDKKEIEKINNYKFNDNGFAVDNSGDYIRRKVICLLDDWHIAPPEVQAVGFELFTYHKINGYEIDKEHVVFCLAGNASASAGARNSFSAVMNRVCKLYVTPDFTDWRDNFAYQSQLSPEVISFLDNSNYRAFFLREEDTKDPWPSPRSWTELARAHTSLKESGINFDSEIGRELLQNIVAGHVGVEAASSFIVYHDIYSKINTKKIFDTGVWNMPSDMTERFAFVSACSAEYYDRYEKNINEPQATKLISEMFNIWEAQCPEMALRAARFLSGRNAMILTHLVKNKALQQKTVIRLMKLSKELEC